MIGIYNNAQSTSFPVYTYGELVTNNNPYAELNHIELGGIPTSGLAFIGGHADSSGGLTGYSLLEFPVQSSVIQSWTNFYYTEVSDRCAHILFSSTISFAYVNMSYVIGNITVGLPEMFYGCSNLSYVVFSKMSQVVHHTFSGCTHLESVYLPECTHVGPNAFNGCSVLRSINLPKCKTLARHAFIYCGVSYLSIPQCTEIKGDTFYHCDSLLELELPGCSSIPRGAIESCSKLNSLYFTCGSLLRSTVMHCPSLSFVTFDYDGLVTFESAGAFSQVFVDTGMYNGYTYPGKLYVRSSYLNAYKIAPWYAELSSRIFPIPS